MGFQLGKISKYLFVLFVLTTIGIMIFYIQQKKQASIQSTSPQEQTQNKINSQVKKNKIAEGNETSSYLTNDELDNYLSKFVTYEDWELAKKEKSYKTIIRNEPISDAFLLYLFINIDNHYYFPKRLLTAWVDFSVKNVADKKLLEYITSEFKWLNLDIRHLSQWQEHYPQLQKKLADKKSYDNIEQLRLLTYDFMKKSDEYHESMLMINEAESLLKFTYANYVKANKKKLPWNEVDALFIASEKIHENNIFFILSEGHRVGLPSNISRGWAELGLSITQNKKLRQWFLKQIKTLDALEAQVNGIGALEVMRHNPDYRNRFLSQTIITDEQALQTITQEYLELFKDIVSPADAESLQYEALVHFDGDNGRVNEAYAQVLAEQALSLALQLDDAQMMLNARNTLGVIFDMAIDPMIRNKKLAKLHIEESFAVWLNRCEGWITNNTVNNRSYYGVKGKLIQSLEDCYHYDENPPDIVVGNVISYYFFYGSDTFADQIDVLHKLYEIYQPEGHITKFLPFFSPNQQNPLSKAFDKEAATLVFDSAYNRTKELRFLDAKCLYIAENSGVYGIKMITECYKNLVQLHEEVGFGVGALMEIDQIYDANDRYALIQDNQVSYERLNNINNYFDAIRPVTDNIKKTGKYALVIGNQDYVDKLITPMNDAKLIAENFENMNFKTYTQLNLDLQSLSKSLGSVF